MDNLRDLSSTINEIYSAAMKLESTAGVINVNIFQERANYLSNLMNLNNTLKTLQGSLQEKIVLLTNRHEEELHTATEYMRKLRGERSESPAKPIKMPDVPSADSGWNLVTKSKKSGKPQMVSRVPVGTTKLTISAVKVQDWGQLKAIEGGQLYYVESANHFAIKLNGIMYHGNIGIIYTNERDPVKIKDCKYGPNCTKNQCDYYHDPMHTPDCKDVRNFIAGGWLYAPPDSEFRYGRRPRRYGSFDHLERDLPGLKKIEIDRFHDQTMHDILCSLLLHENARAEA